MIGLGLTIASLVAVFWLVWQLLRQNGRILLRLEELEKRYDEFGFGGEEGAAESPSAKETTISGNGDARANRFRERSVARSKIRRDGLKAGTPAPGFRLPRLDGRGELSLEDFHGRRVLLVFSSPHCGPCNALAPILEKFHRAQQNATLSHPVSGAGNGPSPTAVQVLMLGKGEAAENRAKVKEHGLTFPIVLQQQWEISRLYAMFATPVAYLIDAAGVISTDVAVGTDAISGLMVRAESQFPQGTEPELAPTTA